MQIRNNQGFSLISVMVAGAIGMIVVAGMTEAITRMMKGQKAVSVSSEWNEFFTAVDKQLKYDSTCEAVLSGTQITTAQIGNTYPARAISLNMSYGGKPGPIKEGTLLGLDLEINSITLQVVPPPASGPRLIRVPVGGVMKDFHRHLVRIQIAARKVQMLPGGQEIKPREIVIPVLLNPATLVIASCHGEFSVVEACIANGGTWVESNPPDQRCVPQSFCKHGGSYAPGVFINPLTGGNSCPTVVDGTPYVAMMSGQVSKGVNCPGKNCTIVNSPAYQCLKCN